MDGLVKYFNFILKFDNQNLVALDKCHNLFLIGAVLSKKPEKVLELGIGSGYVTWSLIFGLEYNRKGKLTSIDSWLDWRGKEPNGIEEIRKAGVNVIAPIREEDFVRNCASDEFDILVSDADHFNSHKWTDEHLRITKPDGFLFFHDTNQKEMFPNLLSIEKKIKELNLPYYHFTEKTRDDERCDRGWLFVMNKKNNPINNYPASSATTEPFLDRLFHSAKKINLAEVGSLSHPTDKNQLREWNRQGKEFFAQGDFTQALGAFEKALVVNPNSVIAHTYLSDLYWQKGDVQKSLEHHTLAQSAPLVIANNSTEEFKNILNAVRPYTLLSEARLLSLYSLAKQICLDDIPGNFVECGTCKGGAAALLAAVIQHYSLRPRCVYAFDTFEGMPDPTESDRHNGIPANQTGFGAGTLKAPISENLEQVCHSLGVRDIVVPVQGLFAQTLPHYKTEIGAIALLHADADWYESTLDIFNTLYESIVPNGIIQIDDYGHWEGCKKAIHEFERRHGTAFALRTIDYTGVWFRKENSLNREANHWGSFWHLAQAAEKMGNVDLAEKSARTVLQIVPKLLTAEEMLVRIKNASKLPPSN